MTTQRTDARSIETRTSWVVASVSLILLGLSFGGPWITAVGLKEIASDTGGARQVPSLAVSLAMFGSAVGGLFSLVFAYAYGRIGRIGPRALSAAMALLGFITIVLVPFLKYPPNPPSIGDPSTIGSRTALFFTMIVLSLVALAVALVLARRLANRLGTWNATLAGGTLFLVLIGLASALLPDVNEIPEAFSASLLWQFRVAAFGLQAVQWAALGILFGAFAQPLLSRRV